MLLPATLDLVKGKDVAARESLLSLLALVPESSDPSWTQLAADPAIAKLLRDRRAIAQRQRQTPPPALRKLDFCNAPAEAGSGAP